MLPLTRLCVASMVALAALATAGCSTPFTVRAGSADSLTGGVALLYDERLPDEQIFRRYELAPDGTLSFGGGRAAMLGTTDWSTTASRADLDSILDALRASELTARAPECTPEEAPPKGNAIRVEVAWPGGKVAYDLAGPCPSLVALRDALHAPTRARFDRTLEALPDPGPRLTPRR